MKYPAWFNQLPRLKQQELRAQGVTPFSYRHCYRKVKCESREEAQCVGWVSHGEGKYSVYECTCCNGWHISKGMSQARLPWQNMREAAI